MSDLWPGIAPLIAVALFPILGRADLWCTAYYPGWERDTLPPAKINFSALTHVVHFSVVPKSDGSLDNAANVLTPTGSAELVSTVRRAGRKVLICVGGADSQNGFRGATSPATLSTFVANLTKRMQSGAYDGIDVDWEPLEETDSTQFTALILGLRSSLDQIKPRPLLTVAVAVPPTPPKLIAELQSQLDQINLMAYDLAGPYPGWVTWFNAAIYSGGFTFPSTGEIIPSADGMITQALDAGVWAGKLGLGIPFYGVIWSGGRQASNEGVSAPRQSWTDAPGAEQISYADLVSDYSSPDVYRWDGAAQAAYLSLEVPGASQDRFISFDDPRACLSKLSYARNRGLGGIMIWELAQDTLHEADSLLAALKRGFDSPGALAINRADQGIDLSFVTLPLGSYHVEWSGDLKPGSWTALMRTNVVGQGGQLHVTDVEAPLGSSRRFYRVRTP